MLVLLLRRLSWFDGSGMGFSLEYPTIGLHAISRDVSAYPQEHLYVMVNGKLSGQAQTMHENVFMEPNDHLLNTDRCTCVDACPHFYHFTTAAKHHDY